MSAPPNNNNTNDRHNHPSDASSGHRTDDQMGDQSSRNIFRLRLCEVALVAGLYRGMVSTYVLTPALEYAPSRFEGPLDNLTVEDVVKHLAACGVSYAQMDDLQSYAQNWMSECLEHDLSYLTEDKRYLCEDRLFIATDPDSYPTCSLDDLNGSSATAGAGALSWSGGDGTSLGPIDDLMLLSPDPYGDELDFNEPSPK
ncbi:hypothetical protein BJ138DRAFT_1120535 [Hygrophoropsis aurantiaca]|uniref:Uncharacterized protein n=1 Tax=Hygrophoropsis aurantiaca TaxID=72124 RepID=A0ACB7ZQD5_9AGAM|nr:hypothetical protein BJ138DRAFT_1120535 [Hygrophoropsis aurantiaca]